MHVLAPIGIALLFILVMVLNKNFRDEPGTNIADFLSSITFRKALYILAFVFLTLAFIYTLPIDLAILYAADVMVYFEAFTVVSFLAARGRALTIWYLLRRLYEHSLRALTKRLVVAAQKCVSHYRYATRAKRRKRFTAIPKKSNEDPYPACL